MNNTPCGSAAGGVVHKGISNITFTTYKIYTIYKSYMTAITALTAFVLYSSLHDGKATPVALNIGVKSGNILGNR